MESLHYNPNQTPNQTPKSNTQFDEFDPNRAKFQRELDLGKSKEEILAEVNRPIDALYFGRQAEPGEDAFLAACQAQRNTDAGKMNDYHYNKILAAAINNGDKVKHPEFVDALDYKTLVERYQTAADFQPFVDSFMARINNSQNTPAKIAEYTSDMNKFANLVFGDQWELWKQIKDM